MRAGDFLLGPPEEVAPALLGWRLRSRVGGLITEVRITEVEAYRQDDPASHSFGGPRGRNLVMYGPPGRLYVYRSYGIHWCANVVCGPEGTGAALLIRAGTPTRGRDTMVRRRGREDHMVDGPGKLTEALAIDARHNGIDLFSTRSPLRLLQGTAIDDFRTTPRIGISKGRDRPWRFVIE
ncbi:MAG: DNA-3-methyladenine glycosylase [Actinomycetota bacterium]